MLNQKDQEKIPIKLGYSYDFYNRRALWLMNTNTSHFSSDRRKFSGIEIHKEKEWPVGHNVSVQGRAIEQDTVQKHSPNFERKLQF